MAAAVSSQRWTGWSSKPLASYVGRQRKHRGSSLYLLLLLPLLACATANKVKKTVIGQAGDGTGDLQGAPAWLQERHKTGGGLYFPLKHRSHLDRAYEEANRKNGTDTSEGRELLTVPWGLNGSGTILSPAPYIFYTTVVLGAYQQPFNVLIDTGSSVLWVKCECTDCINETQTYPAVSNQPLQWSNSTRVETCGGETNSYYCQQFITDGLTLACGDDRSAYCYFQETYLQQDGVEGVLIDETITLVDATGTSQTPSVPVGCAYVLSQDLVNGTGSTDGILGLGQAPYALVESLYTHHIIHNSFSVCLDETATSGHLVLGSTSLPDGAVYTPVASSTQNGGNSEYWSATLLGVTVNGTTLTPSDSSTQQLIVDSGTTITILPESLHTQIFQLIFGNINVAVYPDQPTCVFRSEGSTQELAQVLPNVVLNFQATDGSAVNVSIPPFNYLDYFGQDQNGNSQFCLSSYGIASGSNQFSNGQGGVLSIIGSPWLRNFDLLFDSGNSQIGWLPLNCSTGKALSTSTGAASSASVNFAQATNPPAGGGENAPTNYPTVINLSPLTAFTPPSAIGGGNGGGSSPPAPSGSSGTSLKAPGLLVILLTAILALIL